MQKGNLKKFPLAADSPKTMDQRAKAGPRPGSQKTTPTHTPEQGGTEAETEARLGLGARTGSASEVFDVPVSLLSLV